MNDAAQGRPEASRGYEAVADEYVRRRSSSDIGADEVRAWARTLPAGGNLLDLGCGHGEPITRTLVEEGLRVWAVDASPTLLAAFRARFPDVPAILAAVEELPLLGPRFDGVVAWGLLFLLPPESQRAVLTRSASLLRPGGRLLFSAPTEVCRWRDVLTGRMSRSLGSDEYVRLAAAEGLVLERQGEDAGRNHYFGFRKSGTPAP